MPEAPIRLPIRSKPSKRKQGRFKTVTPLLEAGGGSRATSREGSEELEGAVAGGEDVAGDLVDALEGEADVLLAPGVAFSSTRKRRWGRWTNSLHRKTLKVLLTLAICASLLVIWLRLRAGPSSLPLPLLSNGTHAYTPITILLSLDGFRPSYFDSNQRQLPNIRALIADPKGVRARSMQPVFPSLTFPNHWALMTGLLPSWSGIVANDFWDPSTAREFYYTDEKRSWDSGWWFGEPLWSVVQRHGGTAANLMWPGPPVTSKGVTPTYFVPFTDMPFVEKVDQITQWLDLPLERRPDLITAYVPEIDSAGHLDGPDSESVSHALHIADEGVGKLVRGIKSRNLTDIVNLLIVSDHGMSSTSDDRLIFLDDIIGKDGMEAIEHRDGWPLAGLRFRQGTNETRYLDLLLRAADQSEGSFAVYAHETMPDRWHFTGSDRIAPIYIVPALGWSITDHHELEVVMGGSYVPKGNHGYGKSCLVSFTLAIIVLTGQDNVYEDMQAVFMAYGPLGGQLRGRAGSSGMLDSFANLEIFSLVLTSLGLGAAPVSHNGTSDFWTERLA